MSATESASAVASAVAPGALGAAVLIAGPPSAWAILLWAAAIGGGLGSYAGALYQMLRECEYPSARDWVRLAMRVSASWSFAVLVALALAALAGSIDSLPAVAGHPFIVAAVAGFVGIVSPLVVPEIQRRAAKGVREYRREPKP